MANLLDTGRAWLAQKMRDHASDSLVYERAGSSITIKGTWVRVDREVAEGTDFRLQNELRDCLISATELTMGPPLVGDKITEVKDGQTRVYECLPLADTQHWQWLGNGEQMYRVHFKRIS